MKRLIVLAALAAALLVPAAATAHPLGNFTTNRYSAIEISGGHAYVLYVLDLAEIPTYQARGDVTHLGREEYARRLAGRIAGNLSLTIDGRERPLEELSRIVAFPAGVGGLRTTRFEAVFDAGEAGPEGAPLELTYADENFPGRIGWKEVVIRSEEGARVLSSSVPSRSVSDELRAYPQNLLQSPPDVSGARARVAAGEGTGTPPLLGEGQGSGAPARGASVGEGGFAALVTQDDLGVGVMLISLFVAMFWGAAHALTPGHGKAIIAAYLVGTRGTPRHALLLGLIVTVTHTIGVFALGLVTLTLSEFVVPEQLYPWLNLVSAVLVVLVGLAVLRLRLGSRLGQGARHEHPHHSHHAHHHDHHGEAHDHDHHGHGHSHVPEPGSGLRGLIAVGVSGGLLPCPTALVVLLAAISLHRVTYGLLLIVAFSVGLAATITAIGLLALTAKRAFSRLSFQGPVVRLLPAVSAVVIIALGVVMTLRALPTVG
jgi:nickel/cobalt exporter